MACIRGDFCRDSWEDGKCWCKLSVVFGQILARQVAGSRKRVQPRIKKWVALANKVSAATSGDSFLSNSTTGFIGQVKFRLQFPFVGCSCVAKLELPPRRANLSHEAFPEMPIYSFVLHFKTSRDFPPSVLSLFIRFLLQFRLSLSIFNLLCVAGLASTEGQRALKLSPSLLEFIFTNGSSGTFDTAADLRLVSSQRRERHSRVAYCAIIWLHQVPLCPPRSRSLWRHH
jgi:hypothetical protein